MLTYVQRDHGQMHSALLDLLLDLPECVVIEEVFDYGALIRLDESEVLCVTVKAEAECAHYRSSEDGRDDPIDDLYLYEAVEAAILEGLESAWKRFDANGDAWFMDPDSADWRESDSLEFVTMTRETE